MSIFRLSLLSLRVSIRVPVLTLLLAVVAIPAARGDATGSGPTLFPVSIPYDMPDAAASFDEVRTLILEHYYSTEISEQALYWAAINGMLRHISPPDDKDLAHLWSKDEYQRVADALHGVSLSLGIRSRFDAGDGSLTVTDVVPGSPADGKLQVRDRVMRIDGEVLRNRSVSAVNALLQGAAGSSVTLKVVRDIDVLDITIERHQFDVQTIKVAVLPGNTAYLSIASFTRDLSVQLDKALRALPGQGIDKLIVDLRGNTGGVFAEGLRSAELFLPESAIILRTLRRPDNLQNYVSATKQPIKMRMVILVDRNTASSSEIFASALQAHKLALLVGTRTFGKGVFEETFKLDNDFRVKFIVGAMFEPRGVSWQGSGLKPDFYIQQDEKLLPKLARLTATERLKADVQLLTGWKLLN